MADYYTKLSESFALPEKAAEWLQALDDRTADLENGYGEPDPLDAVITELFDDEPRSSGCTMEWRPTEGALWVMSDGDANLDSLLPMLQATLVKFDLAEPLTLQWSYDCSKPRLDAYGGGAAIVTKDEIKQMHTAHWIEENRP